MAESPATQSPVSKAPVLKVMVSSTIVDLPEHRRQVEAACLDQEVLPLMMEHQPASYLDPVAFSLDLVNRADAYVGVYAHRYGYIPAGHEISLTEMEYNRACERGIDRLIFIIHKDHPIKREDVETGAAGAKLKDFKDRVGKENFVKFFTSPIDLKGQVISALTKLRPPTGPQALHQLPPPPADFTGRENELVELRAAITQDGVTISGLHGQGGVGKTALALKLGEEIAPKYPDAQIYMDLRGVSEKPLTAAEAMAYVVRVFQPEAKLPESVNDLKPIYLSMLSGKHALLLMDNARDAAQVAPLLPPAGSVLLVTSRIHFVVPGLRAKNLDTLPPADAKSLLLSIADRIDGEAEAIAKLCGYLPLALRLAATALAERVDLSPAAYRQWLEKERLKVLKETATDPSVEASIGLSYGLLDPEMQKCWRMLAVFPDTFDAPAAAAVWDAVILSPSRSALRVNSTENPSSTARDSSFASSGPPPAPHNDRSNDALSGGMDAAQDVLSRLVQYSLLEWNDAIKPYGRYRLHDLVGDFASTRLEPAERATAGLRHAQHFASVLRKARDLYLQGGESVKCGLALFDLEWGNIQAGQVWAAARADQDNEAARLCGDYPDAGVYCLDLRQHPRDRIRWLEAALAAARRLKDRAAEGKHLGNLGNRYWELGETRRAIEYHEQALAIGREIGDRRGEGNALGNLGVAYYSLGETRRAIGHHEQRLAIAREAGDRRGEGTALGNLGNAYYDLGEIRRAIELYEQSLAALRETGDRRGEGSMLGNLGSTCYSLGETDRAIDYCEQQLAITREIGDRRGEASALYDLSLALDKLGQRPKAIEHAEAALKIYDQIEAPAAAKVRSQLEQWKA